MILTNSFTKALLGFLVPAFAGAATTSADAPIGSLRWSRPTRSKSRGTPKEQRLDSTLKGFPNYRWELLITVNGKRAYLRGDHAKELREIAVKRRPSKAVLMRVNSYGQTVSKERLI